MKFFILLLAVGLVVAQEDPTTESSMTTESSGRQECDGRGTLVARIGCTETCRRPWKIGESPIFTVAVVGEPCKTSRRSEENDGQCEVSSRSKNIGVCKAL